MWYPKSCLNRQFIILDHPVFRGSKDDQFVPFRGGVVELIVSIILTGKHTDRHFSEIK
jgi:hypothetical protein